MDAHEVAFVDAACLEVLAAEARLLADEGGALRLVAASSGFAKIVEVAGHLDLFPAARQPTDAHVR